MKKPNMKIWSYTKYRPPQSATLSRHTHPHRTTSGESLVHDLSPQEGFPKQLYPGDANFFLLTYPEGQTSCKGPLTLTHITHNVHMYGI